ncbi:MAG TPA: LysM domain-containing protein, partial [Caldimonas sp.]|nr:LysM domain-containing protein [Caldimonas sp.]
MIRRNRIAFSRFAVTTAIAAIGAAAAVHAATWPITAEQRSTAERVAEAGVPLSEILPDAPDSYTVKPRDTLWAISGLYLKTPWRWPELWGMNLDEIRNPHLIYPGQILFLDKSNGRARLRLAQPVGLTEDTPGRLSPRVRAAAPNQDGIASIPFNLIEPFLNEAVILDTNELAAAPRIVAAQEGSVLLSRGELAYVRGNLTNQREYRVFREPKPLRDPSTNELLGWEARYVGTADYVRQGETRTGANGRTEIVPATFMLTSIRLEA